MIVLGSIFGEGIHEATEQAFLASASGKGGKGPIAEAEDCANYDPEAHDSEGGLERVEKKGEKSFRNCAAERVKTLVLRSLERETRVCSLSSCCMSESNISKER